MNDDPIRDALDALAAVPTERVACGRPPREVVGRLLAANGTRVSVRHDELTEDVDGFPLGVTTTTSSATLCVSLEALGWTDAEWNDPTITK